MRDSHETVRFTFDPAPPLPARPYRFIMHSVRCCGIAWYHESFHCEIALEATPDARLTMMPKGPMTLERAAWWRRLGYAVLTHRTGGTTERVDE